MREQRSPEALGPDFGQRYRPTGETSLRQGRNCHPSGNWCGAGRPGGQLCLLIAQLLNWRFYCVNSIWTTVRVYEHRLVFPSKSYICKSSGLVKIQLLGDSTILIIDKSACVKELLQKFSHLSSKLNAKCTPINSYTKSCLSLIYYH